MRQPEQTITLQISVAEPPLGETEQIELSVVELNESERFANVRSAYDAGGRHKVQQRALHFVRTQQGLNGVARFLATVSFYCKLATATAPLYVSQLGCWTPDWTRR